MRCRNLKLVNKTGKIVLAVPSWVECTGRELGSRSDLWHLHSAWACKIQCTGQPSCVTHLTSLMKDLNLWRNRWKWLIFQSRITNFLHVSTQSTYTKYLRGPRKPGLVILNPYPTHPCGGEKKTLWVLQMVKGTIVLTWFEISLLDVPWTQHLCNVALEGCSENRCGWSFMGQPINGALLTWLNIKYRSTIAGSCTSKRILIYFWKIRFINLKYNLRNFVRPMIFKKLIRFFGKVQHNWT